jgi:rod shape determining protein RodA
VLSTRSAAPGRLGRLPGALAHVDVVLVGSVLALAGLGLMLVYSASHTSLEVAGLDPQLYLRRQALWFGVGLVAMTAMMAIDYRRLADLSPVWYVGGLVLLVLVLSPLGVTVQGAQRWIELGFFRLQPAEFAEVALVVALAAYAATREHLGGWTLVSALAMGGVPMLLVLIQPDLGTALVFGVIVLAVVLVAGAPARELAALLVGSACLVVAALSLGVLEDYQMERLTGFLDATGDASRASYNLAQSQIAIGAGGFTGVGLFEGTQTSLSYVPEQHTDFVFTVAGEELGFLGAGTVVALFGIASWRMWRGALVARDRLGTFICIGVLGMFVFKVFQNIGMTMGLMPITGIPLPFLSYGGSAMIASFMGVGLVLNVGMRRFS